MSNEKPSKAEILIKKVHEILRQYNKLTDAERRRDVSVWGYSNPVATNFTSAEEAVLFFRRFEELEELNLGIGQFTFFADATCFTIEMAVVPKK